MCSGLVYFARIALPARDREMSTGSLLPLERQIVALRFWFRRRWNAHARICTARAGLVVEILREMQAKSASMCEVTFGIVLDICVKRGDFEHVLRLRAGLRDRERCHFIYFHSLPRDSFSH